MRLLIHTTAIGLLSFLVACPVGQAKQATQPDNTRMNQADRDEGRVTADQQRGDRSDAEITRQIRRSIVQDKSLSTYAHNVKVVAQGGKVTLKGPVHSEEEKSAVEQKAVEVVGPGNVTNELTVKTARKKTS